MSFVRFDKVNERENCTKLSYRFGRTRAMYSNSPLLPARPWAGPMDPGRRVETVEDRHVLAKHRTVGFCFILFRFGEPFIIKISKFSEDQGKVSENFSGFAFSGLRP